MAAVLESSACAVQMLLLAFSLLGKKKVRERPYPHTAYSCTAVVTVEFGDRLMLCSTSAR
jgi:hypothetical protein